MLYLIGKHIKIGIPQRIGSISNKAMQTLLHFFICSILCCAGQSERINVNWHTWSNGTIFFHIYFLTVSINSWWILQSTPTTCAIQRILFNDYSSWWQSIWTCQFKQHQSRTWSSTTRKVVVIAAGKIISLLDPSKIVPYINSTRRSQITILPISAQDQVIIPGLIDVHVHAIGGGGEQDGFHR